MGDLFESPVGPPARVVVSGPVVVRVQWPPEGERGRRRRRRLHLIRQQRRGARRRRLARQGRRGPKSRKRHDVYWRMMTVRSVRPHVARKALQGIHTVRGMYDTASNSHLPFYRKYRNLVTNID